MRLGRCVRQGLSARWDGACRHTLAAMRLVFAGTPQLAVPTLEALVAAGHEVAAVLTRPDAPVGRKRVLTPSSVAAAATALGLPVLRATRPGPQEAAEIAARSPELGVVVAYGGILREPLLSTPRHGWINLHFSMLPRWRGAAPVQRGIIAGEKTTGVSIFRLEEGLDTGPLFFQREVAIGDEETAGELLGRLAAEGADDVVATVGDIAAGAVPIPQQGASSYASKLERGDAVIDWSQDAAGIVARIRGVTPEPGAITTFGEASLKVLRARTGGAAAPVTPPGTLYRDGRRVLVAAGIGAVELLEVQPAGKRAMPAADWLRGLPDADGIRLG